MAFSFALSSFDNQLSSYDVRILPPSQYTKYNVTAHIIDVDLSKPEAAQTIYDTCKKNNWKVDYLINNAGFGGQGEFIKRSMEQDMSMIDVNIETSTRLAKLFLPDFVKRGSGKLLNVSSTAATMPGPLQAVYYATKAYVTSWSDALWREVQGTGVTVTCLNARCYANWFY